MNLMFGFATLFALTLLAVTAALSCVVRLEYRSRAEAAVATFLLANFLIIVPIHALGWGNVLTPKLLAVTSLAWFGAVLAASFAATNALAHLRKVGETAVSILRLPVDALVLSAQARSVVLLGCLGVFGLFALLLWQTFLFPSDAWDAMWYHDTMVGYAIQNHGYAPAPLPMNLTQQANGFPRNCEMFSLWFVIFCDRTLLELPSVISAFPLALAAYLLVRRVTSDRVTAMGFGCALLTVPGVALELRTTYIDGIVATYLLGAMAFCMRPQIRLRDGWMAGVALSLLIGSKSMALISAPLLAVALSTRMLVTMQGRRRQALLVLAGAGVMVTAAASVTYLRNWIEFHNPMWPMAYDNARWRIHWPGVETLASQTNMNRPVLGTYKAIIHVPQPGFDFADTRVYGYGIAIPFVLLPLALAGFPFVVVRAAQDGVAFWRGIRSGASGKAPWLLGAAAFTAIVTAMSPALWSARHNPQIFVGCALVCAWLGSGARGRLASELAGATLLVNFVSLFWLEPPVGSATLEATLAQARRSVAERPGYAAAPPWGIEPKVAHARERLGRGDLVVFGDSIAFASVLWNERFSNRIEYIASASAVSIEQEIERRRAVWVVAGPSDYLWAAVKRNPERWEEIGKANTNVVFRRRS